MECDGDTWHIGPESARRDWQATVARQRDNLLEVNGWHILRFNTQEILHEVEETLIRIREAINRYGGVVDEEGAVRRFGRDGSLGPGQKRLDLFD